MLDLSVYVSGEMVEVKLDLDDVQRGMKDWGRQFFREFVKQ